MPLEPVREIEVAAPWLASLQAAFPQWSFSWHDWTISTPAGTPPWLITVTEETQGQCDLMHFAIPAESAWHAWMEKFSSADLLLASAVLLEFALHGKWQEASELPRMIERSQLGPLAFDFWQSLALFAREGIDPMPATVAACRL